MTTVAPKIDSDLAAISAYGQARSTITGTPLGTDELRKTDAYWRACNYLSLGMIYLQDNPLLKEPLRPEHIKNRLLGHWGSSPGLVVHLCPPESVDQEIRSRHDLPGRSRTRRARRAGSGLSGGDILRGLSGQERGRRRAARVLQAVFVSGRDRQSLHAGDAGIDPRRRRAGLCAVARLRRGVRQSRSDRGRCGRRWGVGDRAAGHIVAHQQISEPVAAMARCCRSFI